ncbi:MAG: ggt [Gemmataceae bacterium]|nr:ggt [Gemmataceae bacterium]
MIRTLPLLLVPIFAIPSAARPEPQTRVTVEAKNGMVVCVSPPAADVGVAVLKKGGTAVDAAVAVAVAMAVTWPEAGNIGGGGFMMVGPPGQEPVCIDYRETAPTAARVDLFADGTVKAFDHRAAGIPGTVRGLALAHRKFGKLPWKDLVWPAVKLAEDGFVVDGALAGRLNWVLASAATTNAEFRRVFGKREGAEWQAGDVLVQKDLGRTLRAIAEGGPDAFYTADLAKLLEKEMKAGGGLITAADLAAYKANERKPVQTTYRGYDVYGAPPPSSGGVGLAEMLNILENFDLKSRGRWSPEVTHLMIEAMKRAYCDRARYLGDPDFVAPPGHLISKEYAKKLAVGINLVRATRGETLAPDIELGEGGDSTTHFSVIDRDGMAVSNTYTLENAFGSRIVVRGAGYILNNEMTDFNPKPGKTTRGGQIGTTPNLVAPGKRMLSSQTPTLVLKGGRPVLMTGSPGGRTIINTVACVVVNVIDFEMPVRDAVDAPRLHHQWFPDVVRFEGADRHPGLVAKLKTMGHTATVTGTKQGDAHTIWVDPKTGLYHGAADTRLDGKAAGY